jgi:hypothetical protein
MGKYFLAVLTSLTLLSCQIKSTKMATKNKPTDLSCKLTTPELQQRKSTVIESLKKQVIQTKELENGFAFKFLGTDKMLDELIEFIKTERQCCDFFIFTISVKGDQGEIWLELTGADGTKEFMKGELGL